MFKLMCMSFDGEYKIERPTFETVERALDYSNDLGSKWFFFPFHFVVTATGLTVKDAPDLLQQFCNRRVKTVQREFKIASELPELAGVDEETFMLYFWARQ